MVSMRSRAVFALGLALSAILFVFVLTRTLPHNPDPNPVTRLPSDEATRAELKRQVAELSARRAAEGGPKFLLPEAQRAGWIAAWNKMRDCARAHGFDGITPVQPSYGDGRTPSPVISGSGPHVDAALRACPLDTTLFREEEVHAAIRAQLEREAHPTPRP
jgi:hypothetical protein